MELFYKVIESPVGQLILITNESNLVGIKFGYNKNEELPCNFVKQDIHPILRKTEIQLDEYFRGKRKKFELPLFMPGTDFQKRVWERLLDIPFGETISYQELAERIGDKKKARAVGSANGKNPIPIIVPCHRVIAKDGSLGGFGGGVPIKRYLLELEKIVLNSQK
ncbi:MAG: methylated-DNA--[protein]-cysteine S-methyltransferase [Candidatus Cloacimonetes bacterium]|nr:methylated-DNA--[protein]-cysteine S-methyltransferase [Candidatus Cloacimonadota bacterium]